jgi:putative oxidoreductase
MYSLSFPYDGALLLLRCVVGAILIAHGWPKIKNMKQTAANFDGMGFRPGALWGTLAALLEFAGGIALVAGIFVSGVSLLLALEFITIIIWKLAKRNPFVGGWEFDCLIFAAACVLFTLGAGAFSLGRILFGGF